MVAPYETDPLGDGLSVLRVWHAGVESDIIAAARTSYEGQAAKSEDNALLRRLYRDRHSTPFEFVDLHLYIKMPLTVAAQWSTHRTASRSAASARYVEFTGDYYVPSVGRMQQQSKTNKQGSGDALPEGLAETLRGQIKAQHDEGIRKYREALDMGLARELARAHLGQHTYTTWRWKANLRNTLHFLGLRNHPHAQWEIRQYAAALDDYIAEQFPEVHRAYVDYTREAVTFSRMEMLVLGHVMKHGRPSDTETWRALFDQMGLLGRGERLGFVKKLDRLEAS